MRRSTRTRRRTPTWAATGSDSKSSAGGRPSPALLGARGSHAVDVHLLVAALKRQPIAWLHQEARRACEFVRLSRDYLPGAEMVLCAESAGVVDDQKRLVHLRVDRTFAREAHPHTTWTTSVCTGALLPGAAGLLDGPSATTHWSAYDELDGPEVAQTIQLAIEYDPHPPFDTGAPSKAPKPIYDMAVAALGD